MQTRYKREIRKTNVAKELLKFMEDHNINQAEAAKIGRIDKNIFRLIRAKELHYIALERLEEVLQKLKEVSGE